jgi:hypothetical protein
MFEKERDFMRRKIRALTAPSQASNTASKSFHKCRQCQKLERQYQHTVDDIYSVLDRRFMTMKEKLCELHKLQDTRDNAAQAWCEHKKSHRSSRHDLPGITPKGKCID